MNEACRTNTCVMAHTGSNLLFAIRGSLCPFVAACVAAVLQCVLQCCKSTLPWPALSNRRNALYSIKSRLQHLFFPFEKILSKPLYSIKRDLRFRLGLLFGWSRRKWFRGMDGLLMKIKKSVPKSVYTANKVRADLLKCLTWATVATICFSWPCEVLCRTYEKECHIYEWVLNKAHHTYE